MVGEYNSGLSDFPERGLGDRRANLYSSEVSIFSRSEKRRGERVPFALLVWDSQHFAEVAQAWVDHLIFDVKRADGTIGSYRTTIRSWLSWLWDSGVDGTAPLPHDFYAFIGRSQQGGGGYSRQSQRRDLATLSGFYRWCWETGLVDRFLMASVEAPSTRWQNPQPVDDYLFFNVWERSTLSDNVRIALGLGFWAGLRPIESCRLLGGDVEANDLLANRKATKGEARQQLVPWQEMSEIISELHVARGFSSDPVNQWRKLLLKRVAKAPRGRVLTGVENHLGKPVSSYLNKQLYRCDIFDAGFTPHKLRHSCGTNLLRAGVPLEVVSECLGHTSLETTRGYVDALGSFMSARHLRKTQNNDSPYGAATGEGL